jgi:hypothetical protein
MTPKASLRPAGTVAHTGALSAEAQPETAPAAASPGVAAPVRRPPETARLCRLDRLAAWCTTRSPVLELQHLGTHPHLLQEAQTCDDTVVEVDQLGLGQPVDVDPRRDPLLTVFGKAICGQHNPWLHLDCHDGPGVTHALALTGPRRRQPGRWWPDQMAL